MGQNIEKLNAYANVHSVNFIRNFFLSKNDDDDDYDDDYDDGREVGGG